MSSIVHVSDVSVLVHKLGTEGTTQLRMTGSGLHSWVCLHNPCGAPPTCIQGHGSIPNVIMLGLRRVRHKSCYTAYESLLPGARSYTQDGTLLAGSIFLYPGSQDAYTCSKKCCKRDRFLWGFLWCQCCAKSVTLSHNLTLGPSQVDATSWLRCKPWLEAALMGR